jgi:hypothetical protein
MLFVGAGPSRADIEINSNFSIGGFLAYDYIAKDDLANTGTGNTNPSERNFDLTSEVDLKIKWEWATARFDLNLPADGNEEQGIAPGDPDGFGLEQARFDLMPAVGRAYNFTATGGVFNSPYGREAQDPVDRGAISTGLQFGLTPSNLMGLDLTIGRQAFSLSGIVANEWHANTDKQLSYGFYSKLTPIDTFGLSLGGLFTTNAVGDNYLLNSVASFGFIPSTIIDIEGTLNQHNYGIGASAQIDCDKDNSIRHGFNLRYDYIRARAGSDYTVAFVADVPTTPGALDAHTYQQASLNAYVEPIDHLKVRAEGSATKARAYGLGAGDSDDTYWGAKFEFLYSF